MLREFFKNNLETAFIKSLVSSFNMPLIDVVEDGDYIFSDTLYIYKSKIIRCKEGGQGILNSPISDKKASYVIVRDYYFGQEIQNLTYRIVQPNSFYNSQLHRHLGQYLRCLKGVYGIDLMGMYNCFSYELLDDISLQDDGYILNNNNYYKVLAVPIRLNKMYTVAINSKSKVIVKPMFRSLSGYIEVEKETCGALTDTNIQTMKDIRKTMKPMFIGSSSFRQPFSFSVESKNDDLNRLQKDLYLLIQVPKSNNSSVVVLEGDYTNGDSLGFYNYCNEPPFDHLECASNGKVGNTQVVVTGIPVADVTKPLTDIVNQHQEFSVENKDLRSLFMNPSLLRLNDEVSYAYDSDIIQYLVNNVISQFP